MSVWGAIDGVVVPADRLCVPVTDRGFLLGDAVYETLRTYEGRLFALDDHLDRLAQSFELVRMDQPPDRADVVAGLDAVVEAARAAHEGEFVVRVTVTRGPGPHGFSPRGAGPARTYILARPLPATPASVYEDGLAVVTARTQRVSPKAQDPRIKAASALNLIMARMEADDAGADDALLRDASGGYLEATSANLIAIKGTRFYSARGPDGVLEGVTARRVLMLLERLGLRPEWGPVPAEVVRSADEILLTQTTREVVPVTRLDGAAVGDGVPGPVCARVRAGFAEEVGRWLAG